MLNIFATDAEPAFREEDDDTGYSKTFSRRIEC